LTRKRNRTTGSSLGTGVQAATVELPKCLKFEGVKRSDGTYELKFTKEEMSAVEAAEEKLLQQRPCFVAVDVSEGWDSESQVEIIVQCLKKLGFSDRNLLYQGSGAERVPAILEYGNDLPAEKLPEICRILGNFELLDALEEQAGRVPEPVHIG
jgi:hypothetical protein